MGPPKKYTSMQKTTTIDRPRLMGHMCCSGPVLSGPEPGGNLRLGVWPAGVSLVFLRRTASFSIVFLAAREQRRGCVELLCCGVCSVVLLPGLHRHVNVRVDSPIELGDGQVAQFQASIQSCVGFGQLPSHFHSRLTTKSGPRCLLKFVPARLQLRHQMLAILFGSWDVFNSAKHPVYG